VIVDEILKHSSGRSLTDQGKNGVDVSIEKEGLTRVEI
jgi:hypothetical protein